MEGTLRHECRLCSVWYLLIHVQPVGILNPKLGQACKGPGQPLDRLLQPTLPALSYSRLGESSHLASLRLQDSWDQRSEPQQACVFKSCCLRKARQGWWLGLACSRRWERKELRKHRHAPNPGYCVCFMPGPCCISTWVTCFKRIFGLVCVLTTCILSH